MTVRFFKIQVPWIQRFTCWVELVWFAIKIALQVFETNVFAHLNHNKNGLTRFWNMGLREERSSWIGLTQFGCLYVTSSLGWRLGSKLFTIRLQKKFMVSLSCPRLRNLYYGSLCISWWWLSKSAYVATSLDILLSFKRLTTLFFNYILLASTLWGDLEATLHKYASAWLSGLEWSLTRG